MRAFIPIDIIGTSKLISSSIAEPDTSVGEAVYSGAATYDTGELVIDTSNHLRWKSLIDSNTGNTPDPDADTSQWKRDGYSNKYRMFDWNSSRFSTAPSGSSFTIAPGQISDAVQLDGLVGSAVSIAVTDGASGATLFDDPFDLRARLAITPSEWTYERFDYHEALSSFALPLGTIDPYITITVTGISGNDVQIGRFGVGLSTYLGAIQWSPVVDYKSFSEVDRSTFGETVVLTPRLSIPDHDLSLLINAARTDKLARFRQQTDAKTVFWSGLDDLSHAYSRTLLLGGIHRRFQFDLTNSKEPKLNLRLEGI